MEDTLRKQFMEIFFCMEKFTSLRTIFKEIYFEVQDQKISGRAENSGGVWGVIHPSNFEKISLVGQNIATRREKAKQKVCALKYKGCPTLTCDCLKTVIYRFGVHIGLLDYVALIITFTILLKI